MIGFDERRKLQDDFSFEEIDPRAVIVKCCVGLLTIVALAMGAVYGLLPDPLPGEERRVPRASSQTATPVAPDEVQPVPRPEAAVPPASPRSGESVQHRTPPAHAKAPEPVMEDEILPRRATD
jgi:hypothetical protein